MNLYIVKYIHPTLDVERRFVAIASTGSDAIDKVVAGTCEKLPASAIRRDPANYTARLIPEGWIYK